MTSNSNMKLKLLYIMKALNEKSDETHPLSIQDVIQELHSYDISAERKSIYTDIELLQSYGLDIITTSDKGNANYYHIASREFELPELRILIDAVQSSRFITHKKTEELIRKIQTLTSIHDAQDLQRQVIVQDRVKTNNEMIYYNIDKLHRAISLGRQVQFKYMEYTKDKKQSLKRDGEVYQMSPYAMAWSNENYYLVGYYERYQGVCHFRVDRMIDIEITHEDKIVLDDYKDFNVVENSKKIISMFTGESERVEIEFHIKLIDVVIDKFGKDVKVTPNSEDSFRIDIEVAITPTLLGWLFMFGKQVKVISPQSFVDRMKRAATDVVGVY